MNQRDNSATFADLRRRFPVFTYSDYSVLHGDGHTTVRFVFEVGGVYTFTPRWIFRWGPVDTIHSGLKDRVERIAFHLGIVDMISYWKAFCSPKIHIVPHLLSNGQQIWWEKLFRYGLGEFFHTNGIPVPGPELLSFSFGDRASPLPGTTMEGQIPAVDGENMRILLPLGGGKDSAVSLELLREAGYAVIPFVVNPREATRDVLRAGGIDPEQAVTLERPIDPLLLELNRQGFLNGHTPFSAMLAFASLFTAFLGGVPYIALSNESSASEPTIPGTRINHQYSKSLEFEMAFREYTCCHIDRRIEYFSLLRPLNELQIGALFASMRKYHGVFKSCNAGSFHDAWCGRCAKCLFTYIILAPFMSLSDLSHLFGKDMFSDGSLSGMLDELCGLSESKPFECVGTTEEVNLALSHIVKTLEEKGKDLPVLLQHYRQRPVYEQYRDGSVYDHLGVIDTAHCLQRPFEELITNAVEFLKTCYGKNGQREIR